MGPVRRLWCLWHQRLRWGRARGAGQPRCARRAGVLGAKRGPWLVGESLTPDPGHPRLRGRPRSRSGWEAAAGQQWQAHSLHVAFLFSQSRRRGPRRMPWPQVSGSRGHLLTLALCGVCFAGRLRVVTQQREPRVGGSHTSAWSSASPLPGRWYSASSSARTWGLGALPSAGTARERERPLST